MLSRGETGCEVGRRVEIGREGSFRQEVKPGGLNELEVASSVGSRSDMTVFVSVSVSVSRDGKAPAPVLWHGLVPDWAGME